MRLYSIRRLSSLYLICRDGSLRRLVLSEAVFLCNLSASAQSSEAARNLNCLSRGLFVNAALALVIGRLRSCLS